RRGGGAPLQPSQVPTRDGPPDGSISHGGARRTGALALQHLQIAPIRFLLDGAPTESPLRGQACLPPDPRPQARVRKDFADRKSTRLNSSHRPISYAVFRLKKK